MSPAESPMPIEWPLEFPENTSIGMHVQRTGDLENLPERVDFLAVGEEFCERLLPKWNALEEILEKTRKPVTTFLTPPVADEGLRHVEKLLDKLARVNPGMAIGVNDWGVHQLLRDGHYPFPEIFGRLLNKQRRDPRYPPASSHVESQIFADYIAEAGFARIEWESRRLGDRAEKSPLPGTLRWPYVVLTWTRSCPHANLAADPNGQSALGVRPCARWCRQNDIRIKKRGFPLAMRFQANALVYRSTEIPGDIGQKGIDQILLDAGSAPWK